MVRFVVAFEGVCVETQWVFWVSLGLLGFLGLSGLSGLFAFRICQFKAFVCMCVWV